MKTPVAPLRGTHRPGRILMIAAAALLLLLPVGCSSVKKQTKKITGALPFVGERLQKKVVIVPFANTTFISDADLQPLFTNLFLDRLSTDCTGIRWVKPGDPDYPAAMEAIPRLASGRIDNLALAEMGRAMGANAFLMGNVVSVDAEEREKGFFIFRDTHYFESAQVGFQIYDTGTGAKLMDESVKEAIEVDGAEFDAILARDLKAMYELGETMGRIAASGAEKVCETLRKHPWQGYVVAVQDGKVILSSGREIGMKTGDVLKVYGIGEILEGKDGQRFIVPGPPTGKIEITAVADGRAEAVPLEGAAVAAGYTVRL